MGRNRRLLRRLWLRGRGCPLVGGSLSMSMEFRPLMAESAENRFLSSGGRFRGWVSGSCFFLRDDEPGSGCVSRKAARTPRLRRFRLA